MGFCPSPSPPIWFRILVPHQNEDDQKQRLPKTKTTKTKTTKNKDDQKTNRCWFMYCLTSTKFFNLNVVFTKKASTLGGKPAVHSYAVILMLLGLYPENFRDFFAERSTLYVYGSSSNLFLVELTYTVLWNNCITVATSLKYLTRKCEFISSQIS